MKFKVRKGYVFVTIEEKGKRVPQPNLTILDDEDPKLRDAIQSQMHKLEPVNPPKKSDEGKVGTVDRKASRSGASRRSGGGSKPKPKKKKTTKKK